MQNRKKLTLQEVLELERRSKLQKAVKPPNPENSSLRYPQLKPFRLLDEYFEDCYDDSPQEIDMDRRKFLLEQLYVKENVIGQMAMGFAPKPIQKVVGVGQKINRVVKNPFQTTKQTLQQGAANVKQGMVNVGANRLQRKHDALNKKIQNPNLNSYQKMQMQQKAANKLIGGNIRNRFTFGANRQLKANLSNNLRTQRMREAIIYESITSNLIYALKKELLQKIRRKFMYPYEYAKLQLETVEVNHLLKKYVEYEEKIKEELEKTNGSKYSEMNIRNEYANKFMGSFKIFIKNRRFFGKKQFTDQAEYVKHCLAGRLRTGRPLSISDSLV